MTGPTICRRRGFLKQLEPRACICRAGVGWLESNADAALLKLPHFQRCKEQALGAGERADSRGLAGHGGRYGVNAFPRTAAPFAFC
jgi:hypothetical protein